MGTKLGVTPYLSLNEETINLKSNGTNYIQELEDRLHNGGSVHAQRARTWRLLQTNTRLQI